MTKPNDAEMRIVLPPNPTLVDGDVIAVWTGWMDEMADKEIQRRIEEGAEFDNEGQIAWETARLKLEYCAALEAIVDAIYHDELMRIARQELYRYAAEGWGSLAEVLRDVGPTYASKGTRHQIATLHEDVAPWCEEQGIEPMQGVAMSTLMEAAPALRNIIQGSGRTSEKKELIEAELGFLEGATRDQARARYRTPRDEPGVGVFGQLATGETVLMIVALEGTAEALKQRMGPLVRWAPTNNVARRVGKMRGSKVRDDQVVRTTTIHAVQRQTEVFDTKTGEKVEVLA